MYSIYKKHFNNMIWARGLAYYEAGKVQMLKKNGNVWNARVEGNSPYYVSFTLHPLNMNCNCLYANDGNQCKHMAAALIAYEQSRVQKDVTRPTKSSEKKDERSCKWYRYVERYINRKNIIEDYRGFFNGLEHYFLDIDKVRMGEFVRNADDLIMLLTYLSQYNFSARVQSEEWCVKALFKIRNALVIDKREKLDNRVGKFLQNTKSNATVRILIEYYFNLESDYTRIAQILQSNTILNAYIDNIFSILEKNNKNPQELVTFYLDFLSNKMARMYIVQYYKDTLQYDKAISFLESFCNAIENVNVVKNDEECELFYLYAKTKQSSLSDALFKSLMSKRNVNKKQLFVILKSSMDEQEWKQTGKGIVKAWSENKNNENCLEIFKAIDAPDLIFERILAIGFTYYSIEPYFNCLYTYDRGATLALYKERLKHEIELQQGAISWTLSEFYYDFPNHSNRREDMQRILVHLQNDFKDNIDVCLALEKMEASLYE